MNILSIFKRKPTKIKRSFVILNKHPEIGDKVVLNDLALDKIDCKTIEQRQFFADEVFEIVKKDVYIWRGILLYLNTGTTLWNDEVLIVSKDTPLRS